MANDLRWEPVALEVQFNHELIVLDSAPELTCQCLLYCQLSQLQLIWLLHSLL